MATYGGWPKLNRKNKGNDDMNSMKSRWLERIEITVPFLEIIDEKFFGVSQFLTENSFIFGGAIVSILLGEPIFGDIDIAVSQQESSELISNISASPKWIGKGKSDIRSSSYRGSNMEKHVSQIMNFSSFGAAKVQIITSKSVTDDRMEDALTVVRGVDFAFCALAVDFQGRIFEVLRGAYDDCLKRVIRIVRDKNELSNKHLKLRLDKYAKRGFTCFEDYAELLKEVEGRESEKEKMSFGPGGSSTVKRLELLRKYAQYIRIEVVNDARRLVVAGEFLRKFNIIGNDDRFDEFASYTADVLSSVYSETSPECRNNGIQADVFWDSLPGGHDDNIMFSFDPYDSHADWVHVEHTIISKLADHNLFSSY
jgi:hypothetical protein